MATELPYTVFVDQDSFEVIISVGYVLQDDVALWSAVVTDDLAGRFEVSGESDGSRGAVDLNFGLGSSAPERIYSIAYEVRGPIHFDRFTMDWTVRIGFQATDAVSFGGTAGADILLDGAFGDMLGGLEGADYLNGGAGNDTMSGGGGDDTYVVESGADWIIEDAGGGSDQVFSSASFTLRTNIETLTLTGLALAGHGNAGNNLINGNTQGNVLAGNDGDDTLRGDGGADTLFGGNGADTLVGGTGADTLAGGADDDIYVVSDLTDRVIEAVGRGEDTVLAELPEYRLSANVENLTAAGPGPFRGGGNGLDNTITSGQANDLLSGQLGDDLLDAGDGNDLLAGGAGADILIGGAGRDVASFADAITAVTVNLLTGLGARGDAEGDHYVDFESAVGGQSNDLLIGSAGANILIGGAGRDRIIGGEGADVINGGLGRDYLFGDTGSDTVAFMGMANGVLVTLGQSIVYNNIGGPLSAEDIIAGFENVIGTGFADVIHGDAGNNLIAGAGGADFLDGNAGIDTLSYATSALAVTVNLLTGQASAGDAEGDIVTGFENLVGGAGGDFLTGTDLANMLSGGAGNDTVYGNAGDDINKGGAGADRLFGGFGADTISFADAIDGAILHIDLSAQSVRGGDATGDLISGFENAIGSGVTDYITGSAQANRIYGGDGFDIIAGGGGNDLLSGGGHGNQFYFSAGFGRDVITDFDTDALGGFDVLALDIVTMGTFELIMATARATGAQGKDLIFQISPTETLTLLNVSAAELLPAHFGLWTDP